MHLVVTQHITVTVTVTVMVTVTVRSWSSSRNIYIGNNEEIEHRILRDSWIFGLPNFLHRDCAHDHDRDRDRGRGRERDRERDLEM